MKATGIVRRIDDLGRIVIPREVRRSLRIKDGDLLEIFVDDGSVTFKKYSPLGNLGEISNSVCESLSKTTGRLVLVCDMEKVICASGRSVEKFLGKELTSSFGELVRDGMDGWRDNLNFSVCVDADFQSPYIFAVIREEGDICGAIILISEDGYGPFEEGGHSYEQIKRDKESVKMCANIISNAFKMD